MYCSKCHHDSQPIHKKIHDEFYNFIKANRKWLDKMSNGDIIKMPGDNEFVRNRTFKLIPSSKIRFTIYNNNLLAEPYNVHYIGMRDAGEGSMIEFLDRNMDKIFSWYDVM